MSIVDNVNVWRILITVHIIAYVLMCEPALSQKPVVNKEYATIEVRMKSGNVTYNIGNLNINVALEARTIKYMLDGVRVESMEFMTLVSKQKLFNKETNVAILADMDVPLICIKNIEFVVKKIGVKKVRMYVYDKEYRYLKEVKFISAKHYSSEVAIIIRNEQ